MKINKKKTRVSKGDKRYLALWKQLVDITYIDGYMIEFKNSNFSTLSDNTII